MLALPKSQNVYENPNFTEILLLSSTLPPPPYSKADYLYKLCNERYLQTKKGLKLYK